MISHATWAASTGAAAMCRAATTSNTFNNEAIFYIYWSRLWHCFLPESKHLF